MRAFVHNEYVQYVKYGAVGCGETIEYGGGEMIEYDGGEMTGYEVGTIVG